MFNQLLQILRRRARNGFPYSGGGADLAEQRIKEAIQISDQDTSKEWFVNTHDSYSSKLEHVLQIGGELTTFSKNNSTFSDLQV